MNVELVENLILDAKYICTVENLDLSTIKKTQYVKKTFFGN
ncbi:MAG: hypothetical protein ACTSPY_13065 [Candidatus Helarchaeota archaeon]